MRIGRLAIIIGLTGLVGACTGGGWNNPWQSPWYGPTSTVAQRPVAPGIAPPVTLGPIAPGGIDAESAYGDPPPEGTDREIEVAKLNDATEGAARQPAKARNPLGDVVGKWRVITGSASRICDMEFSAQKSGKGYMAHPSAGCPRAIFSIKSWNIVGDRVILRGENSQVVGYLQHARARRLEGHLGGGQKSVTMVR